MGAAKIVVVVDKDLKDIMPGFLNNRKKDVVELAKFLSSKDFKSIQVIGHKMAGNAGGYGIDQLGEYGSKLEAAAMASDTAAMKKYIDLITDYVARLEVEFK
jgi:HPt (histidine-containing phosphotransfer) domain-containing protein